jgi:uncharacterized protein (DUF433 family)
MTTFATEHKYVQINKQGVPVIAGTTMKVVELVMAQKAYGWNPHELQHQHPYLSMSQIHSALAYYWDHQPELDADIDRREQYVIQAEQQAGSSPIANKMRAGECVRDLELIAKATNLSDFVNWVQYLPL